jgi:hypothetical protein
MWSVRANVAVPSMFLPVSVDAKGTRVDIATGINGQGAGWGVAPTTGWVASYAPGGTQRWQRRFGGGHDTAALPTGIAIGAHQRVWIESTVRDANDRGTDELIRTYRAGGSFIGKMRIDQAVRYLTSGAIVTVGSGAAATGWVGTRYRFKGGRVWRLAR